jgi:uncharacterized membrane protein YdjX (TVP38/TMEM64 family)
MPIGRFVIELLKNNIEGSYIISIFLNIVISILTVIPSFFLTAANIYVFGFWEGTFLSVNRRNHRKHSFLLVI